jgi:hypothetical protein
MRTRANHVHTRGLCPVVVVGFENFKMFSIARTIARMKLGNREGKKWGTAAQ